MKVWCIYGVYCLRRNSLYMKMWCIYRVCSLKRNPHHIKNVMIKQGVLFETQPTLHESLMHIRGVLLKGNLRHMTKYTLIWDVNILLLGTASSRYAICWILEEQQQTISMRWSFRGWTHVLRVDAPCSLLKWVCAVGHSTSLAWSVTWFHRHRQHCRVLCDFISVP
jgi:hypothetical protein